MRSIGVWVRVSKYFINLNQLSTLPHLPSFQNGFIEHVTMISSHFLNENASIDKRGFPSRVPYAFVQYTRSNQWVWVPCFGYFSRSNLLIRYSVHSYFQNRLNRYSAIISSHFMIKNATAIIKSALSIFFNFGLSKKRASWEN